MNTAIVANNIVWALLLMLLHGIWANFNNMLKQHYLCIVVSTLSKQHPCLSVNSTILNVDSSVLFKQHLPGAKTTLFWKCCFNMLFQQGFPTSEMKHLLLRHHHKNCNRLLLLAMATYSHVHHIFCLDVITKIATGFCSWPWPPIHMSTMI
jgi:hypothetical protein